MHGVQVNVIEEKPIRIWPDQSFLLCRDASYVSYIWELDERDGEDRNTPHKPAERRELRRTYSGGGHVGRLVRLTTSCGAASPGRTFGSLARFWPSGPGAG